MSWPVVLAYQKLHTTAEPQYFREKPLVQTQGKATVAKWQTGETLYY